MPTKLKPCPFCGGDVEPNFTLTDGTISGYVCEIWCLQCRLTMANGRLIMAEKIGETDTARQIRKYAELAEKSLELIKRWNKRAIDE